MPATIARAQRARVIPWSKLRGKRKAAALECLREREREDPASRDHEMMEENFSWILENKFHLKGEFKFFWSLGYCQGDGVAFTARSVDFDHLLRHDDCVLQLFAAALLGVDSGCTFQIDVKHTDPHYSHWNTMTVTVDATDVETGEYECGCCGGSGKRPHGVQPSPIAKEKCPVCWGVGVVDHPPSVDRLRLALEEHVADLVKSASRACEKAGYQELEYRQSDEYLSEMAEANEYEFEFDEDGNCEIA